MRILVLALLLPLTACGFSPLYGKQQASTQGSGFMMPPVTVEATVPDVSLKRYSQQFKADLTDRMHPDGARGVAGEYRLLSAMQITETPVAISQDGTISRYNVYITTDLTLTRASDGAPVYRGRAKRTSSYDNLTNSYYSTYV